MNEENLCKYCGGNETICKSSSSINDANDMLEAVRNDNLNRINLLIQEGKSPNIHNSMGYTALHVAIQENIIDIVEYLLTLPDINLEQCAVSGGTPMHLSVRSKNHEVAKLLIEKGANLNALDCEDNTILHIAVAMQSPETVRFILNKEVDVNLTNNDGKTPLHLAVLFNNFELVSMLLYYNADTDIMNKNGFTPFMTALNGHCDQNIQRELFKYEYDYNRETDYFGNTLAVAVLFGSPLIIDLIQNGADVNYSGCMFRSILASILERCNSEIFFYVFPLTNLSILTEFRRPILISFLKCRYNKEDWLKALFLILESDVVSKVINHYFTLSSSNFGLFRRFAKVFQEKNISEDEFVKFVEICLCSGANVMFEDIKTVYEVYSNNRALPHLLNMKIENVPYGGRTLPYIFCSFNKNNCHVLEGRAHLRSAPAPSLLELSRNKAIVAICTRYDIDSSHWYYYILRRLNLPQIIYDFMTFRHLIE